MGTINYAELQQDILNTLVKQVTPVNFKNLAYPEAKLLQKQLAGCAPDSDVAQSIQKKLLKMKVNEKHYVISPLRKLRGWPRKTIGGCAAIRTKYTCITGCSGRGSMSMPSRNFC